MAEEQERDELVRLSVELAGQYLSANPGSATTIRTALWAAYEGVRDLRAVAAGQLAAETKQAADCDADEAAAVEHIAFKNKGRPVPAVAPEDSIQEDYIICLEDGRKLRSMKQHLRMQYGLTPEQYRERWDLPANYPMTAPSFSRRRAEISRDTQAEIKKVLGPKGRKGGHPPRKG